jgi:hypothetical protein
VGWIKKRKNELVPVQTLRMGGTGPVNKKPSPCAAGAGFIEDLMKVKGIGGLIDLHVKFNFIPELGGLSIFFG